MPDGFTVIALEDIPEVPDPEPDDPSWRPVRHYLRLSGFGVNAFIAPDVGRRLVPDHTEKPSGHQELYIVLSGEATFTIAGDEHSCPAGTLVAIRDPAIRRSARSAQPGTSILAVGATPGKPYQITRWDAKWTSNLPQAE